MFVEIEKNQGVTELSVDRLIKDSRDDEDGFTPNDAIGVLRRTNHIANIKQVIKEINKFKTLEERLAFKDFVISAVDGRETSPETFDMLYMLAREGGYNKEFFEAYNNPKQYDITYCNLKNIKFLRKDNDGKIVQDLREYDRLVCDYSDYTKYAVVEHIKYACKECCYQNGSQVNVTADEDNYIGTEIFRFENVDYVTHSIQDDVKTVEYTDCKSVDLDVRVYKDSEDELDIIAKNVGSLRVVCRSDCEAKKIKFNCDTVSNLSIYARDLSGVEFENIEGLEHVYFSGCYNFSGKLEQLKGAKKITFFECNNFPENLDLSAFDEVSILCGGYADSSKPKGIKFKDGAKVSIIPTSQPNPDFLGDTKYYKIEIQPHVDFSKCSEVTLGGSLAQYDKLSFGEGAKVKFERVSAYPKVLDISMCDEVKLYPFNNDIDLFNEVILRDMAQLEDIVVKNFNADKQEEVRRKLKSKVTFVDDKKHVSEEEKQPVSEKNKNKYNKWAKWFGLVR